MEDPQLEPRMKTPQLNDDELLYRARKVLLKNPHLDFSRYVYRSGDYEMRASIFEKAKSETSEERKRALQKAMLKGRSLPTLSQSQYLQSIGAVPIDSAPLVPSESPPRKSGHHRIKKPVEASDKGKAPTLPPSDSFPKAIQRRKRIMLQDFPESPGPINS